MWGDFTTLTASTAGREASCKTDRANGSASRTEAVRQIRVDHQYCLLACAGVAICCACRPAQSRALCRARCAFQLRQSMLDEDCFQSGAEQTMATSTMNFLAPRGADYTRNDDMPLPFCNLPLPRRSASSVSNTPCTRTLYSLSLSTLLRMPGQGACCTTHTHTPCAAPHRSALCPVCTFLTCQSTCLFASCPHLL